MKHPAGSGRIGSVIVMVTVAILLLFGVVGLVVDIGLGYYYRRTAQAAADAAAQAGAKKAYDLGLAAGKFTGLPVDTIKNEAIAFAKVNGFTDDPVNQRQTVEVIPRDASKSSELPVALQSLTLYYTVEVRVTTKVNSLFIMAAKGGPQMTSGAVAIAAVLQAPLIGSVYLLNRACAPLAAGGFDCTPGTGIAQDDAGFGKGVDLMRSGNGSIIVDGGVLINSSANNQGPPNGPVSGNYATKTNGSIKPIQNSLGLDPSLLQFAEDGTYKGKPDYAATSTNGPQVQDPTYSMNFGRQPQVKTVAQLLTETGGLVYGVNGGSLDGATVGPGVYISGTYSVNSKTGAPQFVFDNNPITLNNVTFTNNGSPGTYIFLGGMNFSVPNSVTSTLASGVYVAAGTSSDSIPALDLSKAKVTDNGVSSKGEMFLVTRPDYIPTAGGAPLLSPSATLPIQAIQTDGSPVMGSVPVTNSFAGPALYGFGPTFIKSGNTLNQAEFNITGLKGRSPCSPGDIGGSGCATIDDQLYHYQPALLWQDRRNCPGSFTPEANTPGGCQGSTNSAKITADASSFGGFKGLIYQPRGALFELQGNGTKSNASTVITGAMQIGGGGNVTLTPNPVAATQIIVSLVR